MLSHQRYASGSIRAGGSEPAAFHMANYLLVKSCVYLYTALRHVLG